MLILISIIANSVTQHQLLLVGAAGHSPKTSESKLTPGSKNNNRPLIPAESSNPNQESPTVPKNDTQQYKMYMQMAETILTMLRLSPLLAQEVQRCLNESKTFQEIISHLPRGEPSDDNALGSLGAENSPRKVDQLGRKV